MIADRFLGLIAGFFLPVFIMTSDGDFCITFFCDFGISKVLVC